jgi:S-adenosylmethionine:tRNA ribosyltransferase-isomerase
MLTDNFVIILRLTALKTQSYKCNMSVKEIKIEDYSYNLAKEKIALTPLSARDASKLLILDGEQLKESFYHSIAQSIPMNSFMVFNDTKVVNARLIFRKETGAVIEIFYLEPHDKTLSEAMESIGSVKINCFIKGISRWKAATLLRKEITINNNKVIVEANFVGKNKDSFVVSLGWCENYTFLEILQVLGKVPLPPYINREVSQADMLRYQTVYAQHEGSVAAPTAGLHFTDSVINDLLRKQIEIDYVTLHVGAGTFKPVSSETMATHLMHEEVIQVSAIFLNKLINHKGSIVAVGTTSVRTIESLYWLGVKLTIDEQSALPEIYQWDAYDLPQDVPVLYALQNLSSFLTKNKLPSIFTRTQLLIAPTYKYRLVNWIVTNFHQPKSTLLLLVAAAIGDKWRYMYDFANDNDYRFLSYGDGCLIKVLYNTDR